MANKWQEKWKTSTKGRKTHKYLPDVKKRMVTDSLKPDKWMAQDQTEHENFYAFRKKSERKSVRMKKNLTLADKQ